MYKARGSKIQDPYQNVPVIRNKYKRSTNVFEVTFIAPIICRDWYQTPGTKLKVPNFEDKIGPSGAGHGHGMVMGIA